MAEPAKAYDPEASAAAVSASMSLVPSPRDKLLTLAQSTANLAEAMGAGDLAALGIKVVEGYEKDKASRREWAEMAEEMLAQAAQDKPTEVKSTPWPSSSNVNVPLLTIAALQFNARMYPAAIKGDEAILCKVIGKDNGVSLKGPDGHPMVILNGQPVPAMVGFQAQQQQQAQAQAQAQQQGQDPSQLPPPDPPQIAWKIPPGAKTKRAQRVSEYLNTVVFYRMDSWEGDTDALLTQLPIVGCVFRKLWWDNRKGPQSAMVPALRLVVNENVKSLDTAPRITEEIPDTFYHEICCKQREGMYLDVDLGITTEDEDKPRLFLEQHRFLDLDDDGYDEPYIVTVDHETRTVLRVESNFGPSDIEWDDAGKPIRITAGKFYIKYGFFPHPQGKFYDIGLGHLLKRVGAVIDTAINQLIDAGNAQVAGGGFIAAGLRLQGRSGRSVVRFAPGEYKTVEATGMDLKNGIVERTLPNVSPVTFQVLDFIMGFAREIGGFKDILTGQAAPTAPVGTVLAQIEQGLQVFNAVAKRFFRSAKDEYTLLAQKIARYGGEGAAKDYANVLDDEAADFQADFSDSDMDIRPVSDPSAVTRMQKMAKAQYLESKMGAVASVGGDVREILKRSLEAADVEDIDKILPPPKPQPPNPMEIAQLNKLQADTDKSTAQAQKDNADAVLTAVTAQHKKYDLEHQAMADGMRARDLG